MIIRILFLFLCAIFSNVIMGQDIIVKKDGSIIQVYNLEESNNSYYYSLEQSSDAAILKIHKSEVFSVKKNGVNSKTYFLGDETLEKKETPSRKAVTAQMTSNIYSHKEGKRFTAQTPDGHTLTYQIVSEAERTLSIVKGKYHEIEYVVPEYVQVHDVTYSVTELGEEAFYMETTIRTIQLPSTLKKIGRKSMANCESLTKIILPEGLEEIGDDAFWAAGVSKESLSEIYIPSTVRKIGSNSFRFCSRDTSYRGFCQGYFSNMPDFITEGNCKRFGIDEEAVKAFRERKK